MTSAELYALADTIERVRAEAEQTTRVPLACGHRGVVPASLELQHRYPTAFCESCQDVKPIRRRKPSSRRIGGGIR